MPRESLDAPENVPKEHPSQVALGEPDDEIPRMPGEAPVGLEQPLFEARHGPPLDADRQDQPTHLTAKLRNDASDISAGEMSEEGTESFAVPPSPSAGNLPTCYPAPTAPSKSAPSTPEPTLYPTISDPVSPGRTASTELPASTTSYTMRNPPRQAREPANEREETIRHRWSLQNLLMQNT